MADWRLPEMSPWRRRALIVPPNSPRAWIDLALWEIWMGVLLSAALGFAVQLVRNAPDSLVTAYDFSRCYAPPITLPCERVAYRAGGLNAALNVWCAVMLVLVAVWLLWELWSAVAPKPITDEFLRLLDHSFGRDWRHLRTWPWARLGWAYGFTLVGMTTALAVALLVSTAISASRPQKAPTPSVETSERFQPILSR